MLETKRGKYRKMIMPRSAVSLSRSAVVQLTFGRGMSYQKLSDSEETEGVELKVEKQSPAFIADFAVD
jgi:hypothetical protein